MLQQMNKEFGFGGMLVIDMKTKEAANLLMEEMQAINLGYLAVSLGFYKTLFSAPSHSTSSEIPENERKNIGLSDGLVRISIGLDNDIERTYKLMKKCIKKLILFNEPNTYRINTMSQVFLLNFLLQKHALNDHYNWHNKSLFCS